MMAARRAVMNAHRDLKEHGVIEIDVDGCAGRIPDTRRGLLAAIARESGTAAADVTDRARRLVDRRSGHACSVVPRLFRSPLRLPGRGALIAPTGPNVNYGVSPSPWLITVTIDSSCSFKTNT